MPMPGPPPRSGRHTERVTRAHVEVVPSDSGKAVIVYPADRTSVLGRNAEA